MIFPLYSILQSRKKYKSKKSPYGFLGVRQLEKIHYQKPQFEIDEIGERILIEKLKLQINKKKNTQIKPLTNNHHNQPLKHCVFLQDSNNVYTNYNYITKKQFIYFNVIDSIRKILNVIN